VKRYSVTRPDSVPLGAATVARGAAVHRTFHQTFHRTLDRTLDVPGPVATEEEPDGENRLPIIGTGIPGCVLLRSGWSQFSRRINA
jgi:hypothetical protein